MLSTNPIKIRKKACKLLKTKTFGGFFITVINSLFVTFKSKLIFSSKCL